MKSIEFEFVSIASLAPAGELPPKSDAGRKWEKKRDPRSEESLSEPTANWFATLPPDIRPHELARRFPRIANQLCLLWRRPRQCEEYMQGLLVDERGGRQGFPLKVALEIAQLAEHYRVIYPYSQSVWDSAGQR
jgi:hypothetical protein